MNHIRLYTIIFTYWIFWSNYRHSRILCTVECL